MAKNDPIAFQQFMLDWIEEEKDRPINRLKRLFWTLRRKLWP
jgi:hypothetical protein